jgi:hypothetical protein
MEGATGHKIWHHLFLLQRDKANGLLASIHYSVSGWIPLEVPSSMFFSIFDGIIPTFKTVCKMSNYTILRSDLLQ